MKEAEFLIRCKNCDYEETAILYFNTYEDSDSGIKCPNCEDEYMYVVKKI
jgi:Zn finger protein HypA/HybF involved in hydrogenase expression